MLEIITVINIAIASFMIGQDYESIVEYQNRANPEESQYVYVIDDIDEDGVSDLDS